METFSLIVYKWYDILDKFDVITMHLYGQMTKNRVSQKDAKMFMKIKYLESCVIF